MRTPNLQRILAAQAADRAAADDAAWFATNPARQWRIRDEVPLEHERPIPAPPRGMIAKTIVYQAMPGFRVRSPAAVPAGFSDDQATDASLANEFARAADADELAMKAGVDRVAAKARAAMH